MAINFNQVGSFNGVEGGAQVLNNPTSIQFGSDGKLYVAEQNGTINAFTVELQDGEYVATAHEELVLPNGAEVVKSIQNHNDDGSISSQSNRQVTGLVVTGTATHPVLYVSSSDPRIATFNDTNLDTNSGVVTRLTWNGTGWEALDIIRGLPRSEENHSVNGMVLSADGTKLYLMVGGNTNNGAPSDFFAYTGEYALSGTVLEIDLEDIDNRPILTDASGGQNGTSRQYVYDLPTLDDPTVDNVDGGGGENASGMDENGPWGGKDGFNMAILPADAPMRIFADGLRNQYDIVLTQNGQIYTVDNGSNGSLGGNPLDANGNPTDESGAGEATNTPHNGGSGDPEPLFLLEDGGYYGHPTPARSNQDLPWTVYNNDGDPDGSLSPNHVASLADLVPDPVNIAHGFIIDPSKFTSDSPRLAESGIRIERDSSDSNAIVTLGSSSNGLVEYTSNVFDGALQGSLVVTQFNGNVTLLNLSDDGTSIEPLIDPTEGNTVIDDDGIFPLITGLSNPLDVTTGPNGTIWIAELGANEIDVIAPSEEIAPSDDDLDDDGIINVNDPFIRDDTNGGSVVLSPNQTLLWDFDANQDDNLPGPSGYGGGLTGVMINNTIDYEEFFQEPSDLPDQIIKLDNVKFNTAAGGGTTVVESVSNGDPFQTQNHGEYLFHTGVTIAPTVDTFNIKWSVFNPGTELTGTYQQIGGYIGTGDQSNYLKLVAIEHPDGEIQTLLENDDAVLSTSYIQADDLFNYSTNQQIFLDLEIDSVAGTAAPTISYEIGDGNISTMTGETIDLSGTHLLDAIQGNYTVNGHDTGLAVGLLSSNTGQSEANTFQAIFNDVEISATENSSPTPPPITQSGEAVLTVTANSNNVQGSNFGNNSFQITNTGDKKIAQVELDVTNALYPDTVFDPFGEAGDTISKELTINNDGGTGAVAASSDSYIGTGGTAGYEAIQLTFDENVDSGFESGETVGFSVDMDPNSIAGAEKSPLDSGSNPSWDVGGVSGAELINSTFTVTYTDGTTSTGELQSDGSQAGSQALAADNLTDSVSLTVNGLGAGSVGTYNEDPSVIINGTAGQTARVVLTKGFIQPVSLDPFLNGTPSQQEYASVLQSQLDALAASDFPANNAVEFQTVDVQLTGENQDITHQFDFTNVAAYDIDGEDQLPLGFVASAIDPANDNLTIGPVTQPIYLEFEEQNTPPENSSETILYRVNAGGAQLAATDGDIAWSADTPSNNSPYLSDPGSNNTATFAAVEPGTTVPEIVPGTIFDTERYDALTGSQMQWAFNVAQEGIYDVRLYMGNGFDGTNDPGERVFDVAVEDSVPTSFDDIDLVQQFGHQIGGMISNSVTVSDGILNLEFLHGVENPMVNGIEIVQLDEPIV